MFLATKLCLLLLAVAGYASKIPADLTIDVGHGAYRGYHDDKFDMNVWRGIRYAQAPLGQLRWQAPRPPSSMSDEVFDATSNPPACPQSFSSQDTPFEPLPNGLGDEDCLFLNVFSPSGKENLPVLIWIHGGGYGMGSMGLFDFSHMDQTSGNEFVFVPIQYRLGAFGFLSSEDVAQYGTPNAGLHDQRLAFQWVQDHIVKFGGDPDRVTIAGESAGAGSVLLAAVANKGQDGGRLWRQGIATSPYLPVQWAYNDSYPTRNYQQFAEAAGCSGGSHEPDSISLRSSVFKCLQEADTSVLKNASAFSSQDTVYGTWAFSPVTDYRLISQRPTVGLLKRGNINGQRMLIGHNANEGTYFTFGPLEYPFPVLFPPNYFVPQNITTQKHFVDFLRASHPLLSEHNISSLVTAYHPDLSIIADGPMFDSRGDEPPFSMSISSFARGWQQAANNLFAEANFACPAFWLADTFSTFSFAEAEGDMAQMPLFPEGFEPSHDAHAAVNGEKDGDDAVNQKAWMYQFSPSDALHGIDVEPLLDDPQKKDTRMNARFRFAFQSIWSRFIIYGDPTLPGEIVANINGDKLEAATKESWSSWGLRGQHSLLILNVTESTPPVSDLRIVDGKEWEDGRQSRCSLWADLGPLVMK